MNNKTDLVVKHNSLIRSRYDYTLAELRLVITIASMIKAKDKDFEEYSISVDEYAKLLGSKTKNSLYRDLKGLGKKLLSQPLELPQEKGFLLVNWFSKFQYKEGEANIIVRFDPDLKPYLLELKEQFTKYKLENILQMKSTYSIRLYEIAKSWQTRGYFDITVDKFRELVGTENKYPLYANFKQKVLNVAIKEINKLTDINIKLKEIKTGRKITTLHFEIKHSNKNNLGFLKSEKAFITYIREHYINADIWSGIAQDNKKRELSVDPQGKLYDKLGKVYNATQSKEMWAWLYKLAKEEQLLCLKQGSLFK